MILGVEVVVFIGAYLTLEICDTDHRASESKVHNSFTCR